jgi:hypothetical protein
MTGELSFREDSLSVSPHQIWKHFADLLYANQVELRKRLSPLFFPALSNKNSTSANEYG